MNDYNVQAATLLALDTPGVRSVMTKQEIAHLMSCVRFVTTLEEMDSDESADHLRYNGMAQGWYYEKGDGTAYFGETRFAAFLAAHNNDTEKQDDQ